MHALMRGYTRVLPSSINDWLRSIGMATMPAAEQPAGADVEPVPEEADHQPRDYEQGLADLFDPVKKEQLEAMFPAAGKWERYAEHAKRNGLKRAAWVERGKFNPFLAARWWIDTQGPAGWEWEKCLRKLANNLPARSRDSKHLLTGDFD